VSRDELFAKCVEILHDTFAIDKARISYDSRLAEDLDIDSIDAVDLIVRMKPLVGKRLEPEAFKAVRTVRDVVEALHALLQAP
jgi:acyl carrier protein